MSDTSIRPASAGFLLTRFMLALIGTAIFMILMVLLLETMMDVSSGGKGASAVLPMIAGLVTGQLWYGREKQRPASGRAWKIAMLCILPLLAFETAIFALASLVGGVPVGMPGEVYLGIIVVVVLGYTPLAFLLIRFGIGMGAKQAEKQAVQVAKRKASSS